MTKNNKRNNILIVIIFIIVISTFILNIIKFAISIIGFETCKNVLQATIYLEMLKIDIYVMGILSIIYCINENENLTNLANIHSEAQLKMKSIASHVKILQNQVNVIINNKLCSGIIDILKDEILIANLNDDWSYSNQSVDLMEELRSLSFKIYDLQYTNEKCDVTNTFYDKYFNSTLFTNGKVGRANNIHKIFFYFIKNTFMTYKRIFDRLSEETTSTIQELWGHYEYNLLCILVSLIILILVFIIIFFVKICFDYSYYQLLFLYYYNYETNQIKFQNLIYHLYKTIHEFNCDSVDYFEYIKSNPNLNYSITDINHTYTNFIKNTQNIITNNNQNINNTNNKKDSLINTILNSISYKKNFKRNSSSYHNIQDQNKNNNYINDKNSMNGSLLNGSMNGSSLLFLNNSNNNNNNINLNNNFTKSKGPYAPNLGENNIDKNNKEESIDSLLKFIRKILPNSLKFSIIFIILSTLIYYIIIFVNIFVLSSENTIWKYSINLSMNVLERIPNLMALLIYACFSVIRGKLNLLEGSPYNDNQSQFLKYFEANSLYYSKNIMDTYFANSYFGELLRDNLRINYNFNNYLFQEKDNIFSYTIEWEYLLSQKGYYCINAAIGEVLSFNEEYTIYNFTEQMNYYATLCKSDNTGIDESGSQLEINYILEEISTKFIEFINYTDYTNRNLTEARKKFFSSKDIKRIVIDMQLSLILYYNTISYAINLDFVKKNNNIINQQIMFSGLLTLINFLIIIGLLFSFFKNEKYKILFLYFTEIQCTDSNNLIVYKVF